MNENIIRVFQSSHLSKYALAQRAGVPYTTVSEILNRKTDINKCAAETLMRLAAVLQTPPAELLNEIHILDGVQRKYKGIRYTLHFNGSCMEIRFDDHNRQVILNTGQRYRVPERWDDYITFIEWRIDDYLENRAFEAHAKTVFQDTE